MRCEFPHHQLEYLRVNSIDYEKGISINYFLIVCLQCEKIIRKEKIKEYKFKKLKKDGCLSKF